MKIMQRGFMSLACYLLAALAHILAGGESLSLHSALSLTIFSIVIAALLTHKSGDPIRVALAIFIAQNAGHFILGGHVNSELQMLLAHIGAGILSYHVLRYFDRTLPDLGRAFIALLSPTPPSLFIDIALPHCETHFSYQSLSTQYLSTAYSLRGPPLR